MLLTIHHQVLNTHRQLLIDPYTSPIRGISLTHQTDTNNNHHTMNALTIRLFAALAATAIFSDADATNPPAIRMEGNASAAMERKLDHQLNKHVLFPLDGEVAMEGAVLVSFVVDIEGRLKIMGAESTNPALRDLVLGQLDKVDIGDNPNGTWKIERRRFVFHTEA